MIVTILPSSTNFHAIQYNERKVQKGSASLIDVRNIPEYVLHGGPSSLQDFFRQYSSRNGRISKPQLHVAFSCKGNEMKENEILQYAYDWLSQMGYGHEKQPILIYAHRDTENTHIHVITSRIDPYGKKIDDHHERRKSRAVMANIEGKDVKSEFDKSLSDALEYKFSSPAQFRAIMESFGYKSYEQDDKLLFTKDGVVRGEITDEEVNKHQQEVLLQITRKRQLWSILKKYQNISKNRDILTDTLRKKFGLSLIFFGSKDNPYGYSIVDHSNKVVYKGGSILKINELLSFKSKKELLNEIGFTIKDMANSGATSRHINRFLKRQYGAFLSLQNGDIVFNDEKVPVPSDVLETIEINNKAAWISNFHPKNDTERRLLCQCLKFDHVEKVTIDENFSNKETEQELVQIFNSKPQGDIAWQLEAIGYSYYFVNKEVFAVDWKKHTITNLTAMGLDTSKLSFSQSAANQNRRVKSAYVERGTKRDWEVSASGLDEESEQAKFRR